MDLTPGIKKFLDISTTHVTFEDTRILSRWNNYAHDERDTPILVDDAPFGYRIYPDVYALTSEGVSNLKRLGLSDQFVKIVALAIKSDCYFIQLDGDGCVFDDLEKFIW